MKKLLLIVLMLSIGAALIARPAFADGGGHLWFYSVDPGTLNPPDPLPNPQYYDPNYVGNSLDSWITESIGVGSGDWENPFSMWLGCAQFESLGTKLVISINDEAFAIIDHMTVEGTTVGPSDWNTDKGDFPLPPHGISNSAGWYGFAEVSLGNLYSPPKTPYKIEINVHIYLKAQAVTYGAAKMHFDAYGHTESGADIFSPFSHDAFVIPEPAIIATVATSIGALGLFAYYRKRKP